VAEANQAQGEFDLAVSSLPDYLRSAPTEGLPEWRGELRSGFRSNLLMGVGSNRVDVKQASARAERALERLAEPLSALFLPAEAWPETLLDLAWKLMLRNAAHDSICACSVDDVVDAVLHRYAEARHIGQGLADEALATVEQAARRVLAASSEGDSLAIQLTVLRRFAKANPIDSIAVSRSIAADVIQFGKYRF